MYRFKIDDNYYITAEVLKDDFIIMTKEEVIKQGLYGPGYENKYYKDYHRL